MRMKPRRIAKTAATTKTMIEKTRVMPITPLFSAYVVSPVLPKIQCARKFTASGCPTHPRPASSPRNHSLGLDESHAIARSDDLPTAFMHESVVVVAERNQVRQIALAAPGPELNVMRAGHVDLPVAFLCCAVSMSSFEGSPLRG